MDIETMSKPRTHIQLPVVVSFSHLDIKNTIVTQLFKLMDNPQLTLSKRVNQAPTLPLPPLGGWW